MDILILSRAIGGDDPRCSEALGVRGLAIDGKMMTLYVSPST
jgi:hypothetical protein